MAEIKRPLVGPSGALNHVIGQQTMSDCGQYTLVTQKNTSKSNVSCICPDRGLRSFASESPRQYRQLEDFMGQWDNRTLGHV